MADAEFVNKCNIVLTLDAVDPEISVSGDHLCLIYDLHIDGGTFYIDTKERPQDHESFKYLKRIADAIRAEHNKIITEIQEGFKNE